MTKSMTFKVVAYCALIIAIFLLPWSSAYGEPLNLTGDLNVSGDATVGGTVNASTGNFDQVNISDSFKLWKSSGMGVFSSRDDDDAVIMNNDSDNSSQLSYVKIHSKNDVTRPNEITIRSKSDIVAKAGGLGVWTANSNGTFNVKVPQTNEADVTVLGNVDVSASISTPVIFGSGFGAVSLWSDSASGASDNDSVLVLYAGNAPAGSEGDATLIIGTNDTARFAVQVSGDNNLISLDADSFVVSVPQTNEADVTVLGNVDASTGTFQQVNGGSATFSGDVTVTGTISGDGSGLTGVPATPLPTAVVLDNEPNTFSAAQTFGDVTVGGVLSGNGSGLTDLPVQPLPADVVQTSENNTFGGVQTFQAVTVNGAITIAPQGDLAMYTAP